MDDVMSGDVPEWVRGDVVDGELIFAVDVRRARARRPAPVEMLELIGRLIMGDAVATTDLYRWGVTPIAALTEEQASDLQGDLFHPTLQ